MKHIFLNLKRFDITKEYGGVNSLAELPEWASYIIKNTQEGLKKYRKEEVEFIHFFPEAHLMNAVKALEKDSPVMIGSQGVYREDAAVGGNFGAFTTNRTASVVKAMGCGATLIGHCEERNDKKGVLKKAGIWDPIAVNGLLNEEILCAQAAGLKVLYCIGESAKEQERWKEVLGEQLETGLKGVDKEGVVIGYEPIWSIGPGKTPAGKEYITEIARFIKEKTGGIDVVYGGGLKADNAKMLASIEEIDGGLIALTHFSENIGFYPEEYLEIVHLYLGEQGGEGE